MLSHNHNHKMSILTISRISQPICKQSLILASSTGKTRTPSSPNVNCYFVFNEVVDYNTVLYSRSSFQGEKTTEYPGGSSHWDPSHLPLLPVLPVLLAWAEPATLPGTSICVYIYFFIAILIHISYFTFIKISKNWHIPQTIQVCHGMCVIIWPLIILIPMCCVRMCVHACLSVWTAEWWNM